MVTGWNEDIKNHLGYCGEDVYIGHNVIFTNPSQVVLHDRVRIDPFCLITTELEVHSNAQICAYAMIGGGNQHKVTLEGWNFIGYGSKLFCASEDYSGEYGAVNEFWGDNKIYRGDITFKKYSGVASDVMVMPNVELPIGCAIGAKSFVYNSETLGEWKVYVGNPLKFKKYRNAENVIKLTKEDEWLKKHHS